MNIGNVRLDGKVILAPMAGVCNSAFRRICKEMGASLVCAEMVSDKAMVYHSKKTENMLYFEESERPISQQIFGSDVETFTEAAQMVYEMMHPDIIDINMGCPVPKVAVRSQAGASLLKNPDLIYEIVSSVVKSVPVPVTVKIRSGWDKKSINAVEVAKVCEKAGASAITIHGRTRSELYSGKCDLDIIKKVKEAVTIPVIGNGDVVSIESAKHMLDYTGCDAIMIGRGVLGNPWLIKEIDTYLKTGEVIDKPTYEERIDMCYKHMDYLMKIKPEKVVVLEMRSHVAWYIKGMPYHKEVKNLIFKASSKKDIVEILDNYLKKLYNEKEG
jgi:nifR3 family TIM-barrel protein